MNRRGLLKSLAGIVAGAVGAKALPAAVAPIPELGTPHPGGRAFTVVGYYTISDVRAIEPLEVEWVDMASFDRVEYFTRSPRVA